MALSHAQIEDILLAHRDHECAGFGKDKVCVKLIAIANLPSRFGDFQIVAFWNNRDDKEHVAVVRGDVRGKSCVPIRVHSECLTGDCLGSLRCDCRDQLEAALVALGKLELGALLYLRQEGRGIGLINKIRAYALQDQGLDTVEANLALGFRDEERDFAIAAHMIKSLEIQSVELMTNNPFKIQELEKHGIVITKRIPHELPPNEFNRAYLESKVAKMGHQLTLDEQEGGRIPRRASEPPAGASRAKGT